MLIIDGFLVYKEQDIFDDGCQPDTCQSYFLTHKLQSESASDLIKEIKDFLNVDDDAIELDCCDEDGRIDISRMEDENGCIASKEEIELWKKGEFNLYYANYSCMVEIKTSAPSIKSLIK